MPLSVEIDVLRSLLAREAETEDLDYKTTLDLSDKESVMEIVKDIAAMESLVAGGYLVVGADNLGKPSGTFDGSDASSFDEQRLRSKFVAYLGEPLDFSCALHHVDGHPYLLIGVGTHRDGVRIMPKIGQTSEKIVWNEAEVFVRRGTSSIRWNQHEARGLLERMVVIRKESWRADILETMRSATPAFDLGGLVNVNVEMPEETFVAAVLQLIRRNDAVGLDLLRRRVLRDAFSAVEDGIAGAGDETASAAALSAQLTRIGVLVGLAARYGEVEILHKCLVTLQRIYDLIDGDVAVEVPNRFARGQEEILLQIYAMATVLVTDEKWEELSGLFSLAPAETHRGYWKTIVRKAEVMTARAGFFEGDNGVRIGLIERAKPYAARLLELLGTAIPDQTSLLVQVDVYRAIASWVSDGERLGAYTNFAFYNARRAEPAFRTILHNPRARRALFVGGVDNGELRSAFQHLSKVASREAFAFDGWYGFQDPELIAFADE